MDSTEKFYIRNIVLSYLEACLINRDPQKKIQEDIAKKRMTILNAIIEHKPEAEIQAVYAIQNLSRVNKNLHQLINNSRYHIALVRNLSMRFNTFDSYIYELLKTPQAYIQSKNNNELTAFLSLYTQSPSPELLTEIKTIIGLNQEIKKG